MAVFDSTTLIFFLEDRANAPIDTKTSRPVESAKARIELLINELSARSETIVVPTPVLSEVLVHAGNSAQDYLDILRSTHVFRIADFDQLAAIELATMTRDAILSGDLRAGTDTTRAKLKFDRQIIAIAKSLNESTIYSDDKDIAILSEPFKIKTIRIGDLPMPEGDLGFE